MEWYQTIKEGAEFEIPSVETLWNVLQSSDGLLVADTKSLTVGGRGFFRVIGESVQVATVGRRRLSNSTITTTVEFDREDREWFYDTVQSFLDGDLPPIMYLRNVKNTPLSEYPVESKSQTQL